jgi:hypothetical protein
MEHGNGKELIVHLPNHEEERETVMRLKAAADTIIVAGEEVKTREWQGCKRQKIHESAQAMHD